MSEAYREIDSPLTSYDDDGLALVIEDIGGINQKPELHEDFIFRNPLEERRTIELAKRARKENLLLASLLIGSFSVGVIMRARTSKKHN